MSFSKFIEKTFIPDFSNRFFHISDKNFVIPALKKTGLYIHIPFCKSLCPYCPYDRILYNSHIASKYTEALKKEIKMVAHKTGRINVTSLYIGGGTPTTISEKLPEIIETVKNHFNLKGGIFIETNPSDITDKKMQILKNAGVETISIGIQSFQNKFLKIIGRNYNSETAYMSIQIAKKYFKNINIDLMFALPEQSKNEFLLDLKEAVKMDVDQITAYPLFTYPYSSVGQFLKLRNVKLPRFSVRKKMFKLMHSYLTSNGYYPCSVWGFKKEKVVEFSSVSRVQYIGFGVSAATKVPNAFYMNTFSVPHYIKKISNGHFAEAVKMNYSDLMDDYYYLYWKLYETKVPISVINKKFSSGIRRRAYYLIKILLATGMAKKDGRYYALTKRGMFYVHLMQNYFAMRYISKVWSEMLKNPEPEEIIL